MLMVINTAIEILRERSILLLLATVAGICLLNECFFVSSCLCPLSLSLSLSLIIRFDLIWFDLIWFDSIRFYLLFSLLAVVCCCTPLFRFVRISLSLSLVAFSSSSRFCCVDTATAMMLVMPRDGWDDLEIFLRIHYVRKRKDPSYRSLQSKVVIFPGLNPNEKPKEIVSFPRAYAIMEDTNFSSASC